MRRILAMTTAALLSIYPAQAQKLSLKLRTDAEYKAGRILEIGLRRHNGYATKVDKAVDERQARYQKTRKQFEEGKIEWKVARNAIAEILLQQGVQGAEIVRGVEMTKKMITEVERTYSDYDDKYLPEMRASVERLENVYVELWGLTMDIDLQSPEWLTLEQAKEINVTRDKLERELKKRRLSRH